MTSPSGNRQVRIVIAADVADAIRGFRQVEEASNRVGRGAQEATQTTSTFGEKLKQAVANVGVATGFDAIKAGFGAVVSKGLDYERNMNTLQAVTGATADQMKAVGEKAQQLGNDITIPGASASDAAEAMRELAKGGLSVDQSMQAATGTLRLATAAQVSGGQAAEIQANALNAFRLSADKADHVADLLANSANAASGEVTDMAAALQQSATVAQGFGISIDDTTTTLALFAKNGIMGSDAGTSFKTMLTQLASPTEKQAAALDDLNLKVYDANGKFVGMRAITEQLATAKGKLTTAEYNAAASTAFGTDAIRAANILGQEGIKGWKDMATAVEKTGGAQELAAAQSQGLSGALDRFQNSVDAAALKLYEKLQPAMSSIVDMGGDFVGWMSGAFDWFTKLPTPIIGVSSALGAVILLAGPLRSLWTSMGTSLAAMRTSFAAFGASVRAAEGAAATFGVVAKGAMGALGGPIGLAIIGVTTALSFMTSGSEEAAVATTDFSDAIDENTGKLKDNASAIIAKAAADGGSFDAYEKIGGSVKDYTSALAGNYSAQDKVHTAILDAAEAGVRQSSVWGQVGESLERQGKTARDVASEQLALGDSGKYISDGMTAALTASAKFASDTDSLTTSQRQARQALEGTAAAANSSTTGIDGYDGVINNAVTSLSGMDEKLFGVEAALGGAGDAASAAADETNPYADAVKAAKDAATEADTAVQYLTMSLQLAAGKNITAEQATRANEASMRDIAGAARAAADAHDAVTDAQTTLDEMTAHLGGTLNGEEASASNLVITQQDLDAQTRKVAEAKDREADASDSQKDSQDKAAMSAMQMVSATKEGTEKTKGLDAAIKAATAVMVVQREKFVASTAAAVGGREAAEKLADAQGLIPENVETMYSNPGVGKAISDAGTFLSNLQMFNGKTYTANINANYNSKVGAAISGAAGDLFNFADGGMITGPGGPREDNHVVRVSAGEYVINAASTAKYRDEIEAINLDKFADGGLVGRPKNHKGPKDQGGPNFNGDVVNAGQSITGGFLDNVFAAMTEDINAFQKAVISAFSGGDGNYPEGTRGKFMQAVASKMGTEYVWGAAGPDVFDCSGLMSWALAEAGASVGRLTAEGFNSGFPHIPNPNPGSLVTFDTGRLAGGQAGHIGMVLDPGAGTMMHTDGAGPARTSDYRNRGGLIGYVDPIGGKVSYSANQQGGDPPASLVDAIRRSSSDAIGSILGSLGGGGGSVGTLDSEQSSNARAIASVALARGLGRNGVLAGIVTAITESTLHNVAHGDAMGPSSTGLFQQMPPWGSYATRMSPTGSAGLFFNAMTSVPGWSSMSIPHLAQAVQQSEFSDGSNYAGNMAWAQSITDMIMGGAAATAPAASFASNGSGAGTNVNGRMAFDNGGLLQPGWTQVYNGLGKPEKVFTDRQWSALSNAGAGADVGMGNGRPASVVVNARVFVGDREITEIVRVETDTAFSEFSSDMKRGRLQPTS